MVNRLVGAWLRGIRGYMGSPSVLVWLVTFMVSTIALTMVLTYASLGHSVRPRILQGHTDHGYPHLWLRHQLAWIGGPLNYYRINYSSLRDDLIFWFMISALTVFLSMAFYRLLPVPFSRLLRRVRKPVDWWVKRMKLCKMGAIIGVFWGLLGCFIYLELSMWYFWLGLNMKGLPIFTLLTLLPTLVPQFMAFYICDFIAFISGRLLRLQIVYGLFLLLRLHILLPTWGATYICLRLPSALLLSPVFGAIYFGSVGRLIKKGSSLIQKKGKTKLVLTKSIG